MVYVTQKVNPSWRFQSPKKSYHQTPQSNLRMKKKVSIIVLVYGMWAAPVSASEPYFSTFVGNSDMNHVGRGHDNTGGTIIGAIGLDFENNFRLEAEVGYQAVGNNGEYGSNLDTNVATKLILANAYNDISCTDAVIPYITAGAGGATVNPSPGALNSAQTSLAYQLGAGITVPISENVKLDARYRYFVTPKVILDPVYDNNKLSSNTIFVGLRFNF